MRILRYPWGKNLGDTLQSMVFEHFIRQNYCDLEIDFVGRDFPISISSTRPEPEFNRDSRDIILTGWLTQNPTRFLSIQRNLTGSIGIHLATEGSIAFEQFGIKHMFLSETFRNEFSRHMISSRDRSTEKFLASKGIYAPFVGCVSSLVAQLDLSFIPKQPPTDFLFVDIDPKIKEKILEKGLHRKNSATLTNTINEVLGENEKERRVKILLGKILSAEIVFTSRLHVALPSVALGKPTILISSIDPRFEGIADFLNSITKDDALMERSVEEMFDFAFTGPTLEMSLMRRMVTSDIAQFFPMQTREKMADIELDYESQVLSEVSSALIQQLLVSRGLEDAKKIELDAVVNTRSWKLTAPLRRISQLQEMLRK